MVGRQAAFLCDVPLDFFLLDEADLLPDRVCDVLLLALRADVDFLPLPRELREDWTVSRFTILLKLLFWPPAVSS